MSMIRHFLSFITILMTIYLNYKEALYFMTIEQKMIDTIRVLSADMIQKANSGHPGLPLGSAAMAYTLWQGMNHNGMDPKWDNRDRFVLSAGHGSALEYSLLYLFGYDVTLEDLKQFRQSGSKTPGHPEYGETSGVEISTGPLGQGIANGVGMAIAEKHLEAEFNHPDLPIVDHYTYVLCGDGCLMEGISAEASSLAGTLGLGKLIVLYDSNRITIEGSTDLAFDENVEQRYLAYHWQVLHVADANDTNAVKAAIQQAKEDSEHPSLIIAHSTIGYGCKERQGTAKIHGEPIGEENLKLMKKSLGFDPEQCFAVSDDVLEKRNQLIEKGKKAQQDWEKLMIRYQTEYPQDYLKYQEWMKGEVSFTKEQLDQLYHFDKAVATRQASGTMINRIADMVPFFLGGSADLAPSNKTHMEHRLDFSKECPQGSNLHFGIREHAMAAICNGMMVHKGCKVYCSTFFVFSDYMKGAMRLSALMKLPVTYVLTHDSICVGEDGPTHEPIEQLAALRSMPNMITFRPADARETAAGWIYAVSKAEEPISLILSRQTLPLLEGTGENAMKGAYALKSWEDPDVLLMASGSETALIMEAAQELEKEDIRANVISMPSMELYEMQSDEYKEQLMPNAIRKRVAVEASASFGWHKYTGLDGKVIAIDHFGASGKAQEVYEANGFTKEHIIQAVKEIL